MTPKTGLVPTASIARASAPVVAVGLRRGRWDSVVGGRPWSSRGVPGGDGADGLVDDLSDAFGADLPARHQECRPEDVVGDHAQELGGCEVHVLDPHRSRLALGKQVAAYGLAVGQLPVRELRVGQLGDLGTAQQRGVPATDYAEPVDEVARGRRLLLAGGRP